MVELSEERYRLLIDVSIMHYQEGLTQQEIANRIGVSRPQISRLLSAAKEAGIVRISIENPFSEEYRTERMLREAYGLFDVSIVDVPDREELMVLRQMTQMVSIQFDTYLKDNGILGVMSGHTIYGISKAFTSSPRENLRVVSLSGGSETLGNLQANNSAHYFADKFGCRFYPLHAPLVVASPDVKDILEREREIAQAIELGRQATVALVGIGTVDEHSPFFGKDLCNMKGKEELLSRGAVAGLGSSFIDRNGNTLDYPEQQRIMAISAETLRKIPKVIGVAFGKNKVEAIAGVLKGKWIDVLVTTQETAKELLKLKK